MKSNKNMPSNQPQLCSTCGRILSSRNSLIQHSMNVHGINIPRLRRGRKDRLEETQYWWLINRIEEGFGSECVEWPFSLDSNDYSNFWNPTTRRSVNATHIALELTGKPRPAPPYDNALHSCDNPPCFNPNHLEWNTLKANVEQSIERNRWTRGELVGTSKLTEHDVKTIFAIRALGFSYNSIGHMFNIHKTTVGRLLTGKSWTHLNFRQAT